MAKKAKTPPPPRRPVQAPQQRSAPRAPRQRSSWSYLFWFAGAGLVILIAVLGLLAFSGGDGASRSVISSKYCTEEEHKGLSPDHLSSPDAKVTYNSFPPSSGPHYQSPAPWGIYEEPVKQTILVHNLEHGGIVLQYGKVGEEKVREILAFFQNDPYGLVVAPYPRLGKSIALTAWNEPPYERGQAEPEEADAGHGYVLTCTQWDADAAAEFRDKRRNKAGERFGSIKDMAPGTQ